MHIHLKTITGFKKILEDLTNLTEGNIKIDDYRVFFDIELNTSYESHYLAIFSEEHYGDKDWCLRVWDNDIKEKSAVIIPVEFIDTIFRL